MFLNCTGALLILSVFTLSINYGETKPPKRPNIDPFVVYNRNSQQSFTVKKLECIANPSIVQVNCVFTPVVNMTGAFSLQTQYRRTVVAVLVEIRMYSKKPTGTGYKTIGPKQKLDFCSLTTHQNAASLFSFFLPPNYEKNLPTCPLSGRHISNFTLPLVPVDPVFFRAGDYRMDLSYTTDDEVLVWRLIAYFSA